MNDLNEQPSASRIPSFLQHNRELLIAATVALLAGTVLADHFGDRLKSDAIAGKVQEAVSAEAVREACSDHQTVDAGSAHACCNTTTKDSSGSILNRNGEEQGCANN